MRRRRPRPLGRRPPLEHIGQFGFALADGHAVQAHGMVERPSEDVDLFTTAISEEQFATATAAAIDGFQADGLEVDAIAALRVRLTSWADELPN